MQDKQYIKSHAQTLINSAHPRTPYENEIAAARYIAETLFADIVDKAGAPYIGHLQRVADCVGNDLKAAAWLHDLIEDIDGWTYDDLHDIGFTRTTIDCIRAVTKTAEKEPYFDAMVRVGLTPQSIPIKRADMRDNGNLLRLNHPPTERDFANVTKYFYTDKYLRDIETGKVEPGTPFAEWMAAQPPEFQNWPLVKQHTGSD